MKILTSDEFWDYVKRYIPANTYFCILIINIQLMIPIIRFIDSMENIFVLYLEQI